MNNENNDIPYVNGSRYPLTSSCTNDLMVLNVEKINDDKDITPFWDMKCSVYNNNLWLPDTSDELNKAIETKVEFWKKKFSPRNTTTHREQYVEITNCDTFIPEDTQVVTSQKIRIYPTNPDTYTEALWQHRRTWNIAVAYLLAEEERNSNLPKEKREWISEYELRSQVREQVRQESRGNFISVISDEAIREVFQAKWKVWEDRKKEAALAKAEGRAPVEISLNYKTVIANKQHFVVQKLGKKGGIYERKLGDCFFTEKMNNDAFMKHGIVSWVRGRWYLICRKLITINPTQKQGRVCSIDPGIRTFATVFSNSSVSKFGDGFVSKYLKPLVKPLYRLKSKRALLINRQKELEENSRKSRWIEEKLIHINRRIHQIENKKNAWVEALHRATAYDIVMNHEVILLPVFKVKEMTKKDRRNIFKSVVRDMLNLSHYKFRCHIKWLAKKYGKTVIDVNEAYTSKTRSWDGYIDNKLGGRKFVSDGNIRVDRDINGARNIMLRAFSKGNYASHHPHVNEMVGKSNRDDIIDT